MSAPPSSVRVLDADSVSAWSGSSDMPGDSDAYASGGWFASTGTSRVTVETMPFGSRTSTVMMRSPGVA